MREEDIRRAIEQLENRNRRIDTSCLAKSDLGLYSFERVQQQRDRGICEHDIQKAINRNASSVAYQESEGHKQARNILTKLVSNGFYGYLRLRRALGLPKESFSMSPRKGLRVSDCFKLINPGGLVWIAEGTYPVATTISLKENVEASGPGSSANLQKTAAGGTYNSIINMDGSNTKLSNLSLTDVIQTANTKLAIVYPTASVENLLIEHLLINDSKYQGLVISASDYVKTITNVMVDRVKVDTTLGGAGIVVGVGAQRATVQNCEIIESGHTAIDVWGCNRNIRILKNYIRKSTNPNGIGIAVSASPDDPLHVSDSADIKIVLNEIIGPIQYDAITAWAGAKNLDINENTIDGALRHGINMTYFTLGEDDVYAKKATMRGNTIRNVGDTGILVERDVADVDPNEFILDGNRIESVGGHGIRLVSCRDTTVIANIIEYANKYGIMAETQERASLLGNIILYPQQGNYGDLSGIELWGQHNTVVGNQITGDAHLTWSIYEASFQGNNAIFANIVNKPMRILSDVGSLTKTEGNIGFVTENCGLASGGSPITVPHGLTYEPTVVHLTPKEVVPYAVSWEADGTNIYIYHSKGSSAYVAWTAKYEPPY